MKIRGKYLALVLLTGITSVGVAAQTKPGYGQDTEGKPRLVLIAPKAPPQPTWHEDSQKFTCPTGFNVYVGAKMGVPFVSCVAVKAASPPPQQPASEDLSGWTPVEGTSKPIAPAAPPARQSKQQASSQSVSPNVTLDLSKSRPLVASPRKDIPTIAKAANGAIVTIVMADNDKPIAQGTGFVVAPDGVIVTNYHVIANGNVALVKFSNGAVFAADGVLAADKKRDLAVIKIHGRTFRTLVLGNSDQIQIGEEVVAIGNPQGLELTVSNGLLSGVRTDEEAGGKFLQTTAPITHGSSGGPLFNMAGEVVGITTLGSEGAGNLNFAIPVNDAKRLLSIQSATLQNLPNEAEPPKESPKVLPTLPSEDQNMNLPAYENYQELLKASDLTVMTGTYACFYDDSESNKRFFVISAHLIGKHTMTAAINSFVDGVQNDSPSLFAGEIQPFSSEQGVAADLPTMYDYKNSADKSHESDVFKWLGGDVTIEHGFGKLMPRQVRFSSKFKLQHSTGRFVEDAVFGNGVEPNGFTTHETGRCIRIPNIVKTPEEQYGSFSNDAEQAPITPTTSSDSLPPNTKVAATPIGSTQPATIQQLQEDMTYCYQHPANNLQTSSGALVGCSEINASRVEQEIRCKADSEAKTDGCGNFLKFVEDLKAGRL